MLIYDDYNVNEEELKEYYDTDTLNDDDYYTYFNDLWEQALYSLDKLDTQADAFIMWGTCGLWYGDVAGGKVLNNLKDLTQYLEDYTIIQLEEGIIQIDTYHHDGLNTYYIKPLSNRGYNYYNNHYYEMSDRELHEKLINTKGMTRRFKYE